jgi:hypothetical protein
MATGSRNRNLRLIRFTLSCAGDALTLEPPVALHVLQIIVNSKYVLHGESLLALADPQAYAPFQVLLIPWHLPSPI